jgi:hypothetical protein
MKPLWLLLVGVVVGWSASGVDWNRNAVGQERQLLRANGEGSILTENLTPPEAVAAVESNQVEVQPFLTQFPGRYQIFADAGGCYRVDTATGCVWHITLHMKPRVVAQAVEAFVPH